MIPSNPVEAMTCPIRVEGIPEKVIRGFSPDLSLVNNLNCGLEMVVLWALGNSVELPLEVPFEVVILYEMAKLWLSSDVEGRGSGPRTK